MDQDCVLDDANCTSDAQLALWRRRVM